MRKGALIVAGAVILPFCDSFFSGLSHLCPLFRGQKCVLGSAFSQSKLEDAVPVELQRQWFQAWGLAEPETSFGKKGGRKSVKAKAPTLKKGGFG
jgi:hypothetical protein